MIVRAKAAARSGSSPTIPDNAPLGATGHAPDGPAPRVDGDPGPGRPARATATGPLTAEASSPGALLGPRGTLSREPPGRLPPRRGLRCIHIRRSRAKWATSGSFGGGRSDPVSASTPANPGCPSRSAPAGRRSRWVPVASAGPSERADRNRGPRFVGLRLTPAAYRHGIALALPDAVMARPTGFNRADAIHFQIPIDAREDWTRTSSEAA